MTLEEKMQLVVETLNELADKALKDAKKTKALSMKDYYEGNEVAFRLAANCILREIEGAKK